MLVLSRKIQEKLIIGNDIIIKVLGVKGNQVRLGITAPSEISILREELCIRRSNVHTDLAASVVHHS